MSEPLAVKLTDIEKLLVKLKKSKDHYHDKIKEYTCLLYTSDAADDYSV